MITPLFRKGFLLLEESHDHIIPDAVTDWNQTSFGAYTVYTCNELTKKKVETEGVEILALGIVVDPVNKIKSRHRILLTLASRLENSMEAFLDYLDNLSGRFVLFVNGSSSFVVQDAVGTQELFYGIDSNRTIISSHAEIIAMIGDYKPDNMSKQVIKSEASTFPGLSTYYEGIQRVTPNTLLDIDTSEIKRIFPREPLKPRNITPKTINEIKEILTNTIELLQIDYDLVLSLSAGIDSRLSLSATKQFSDEIEYYSWIFRNGSGRDAAVASRLCDHLNVQHKIINLCDDPSPEFTEMINQHTANMVKGQDRIRNAYNHYKKFPEEKLEIRSNSAEIGRTSYRDKFGILPNEVSGSMLTKLFGHVFTPAVRDEFKRYMRTTSFPRSNTYNYDPYDLFHWEYKGGNWLSQWLTEKDVSHKTFVLYNNRELLKRMLAVGYRQRRENRLFYESIEKMWPQCLDVPVNPQENQSPRWKEEIKRTIYGMAIRLPIPVYRQVIRWHRA